MSPKTAEGPAAAYQAALNDGVLQPDARQSEVVAKLQRLHDALLHQQSGGVDRTPESDGFLSVFFKRFSSQNSKPRKPAIKGLYIWGGVGRGKTLLCDMFYEDLPVTQKRRLHFHRFMQGVHDELRKVNDQQSPLEVVAEKYAHSH